MARVPIRRNPHDREIRRLALPALGALAAEPLYVLVDTAIVGRLGTAPLGGLAIAGIVLTATFGLCNFLAYSTTGAVARQVGAGNRRAAAERGVDGLWLAAGIGAVLAVVGLVASGPVVDLMGASAEVRPYALTYLRISLLGAPAMLVMLASAGYLRGLQDTRTTLVVAVGSNVLNLVIEIVLVYALGLGIAGSAWGTVTAQVAGALAFLVVVGRTVRAEGASVRPRAAGIRATAVVGSHLVVRTGTLLVALLMATAVASRISDEALAAHQVAFQVWTFLALSLDAIAIAAQAMVGRLLGADDPADADKAAQRMLEWGLVAGVVLGVVIALSRPWLASLFSDDPTVRELAEQVLLVVALLQPVNALVFVLDGILIGAGETRYLAIAMAAALAAFIPLAMLVFLADGTLVWLWCALGAWMLVRLVGMGTRYRGGRWQVTGAVRHA